eukprot:7467283-Ditylum_brightwellii.AAC.1
MEQSQCSTVRGTNHLDGALWGDAQITCTDSDGVLITTYTGLDQDRVLIINCMGSRWSADHDLNGIKTEH